MNLNLFYTYRFSFEEVVPDLKELQFFLNTSEEDDDFPLNVAIREVMPLFTDYRGIAGCYILKKIEKKSKKSELGYGNLVEKW